MSGESVNLQGRFSLSYDFDRKAVTFTVRVTHEGKTYETTIPFHEVENMRINFHKLPTVDPFEYWCNHCGTLNFSAVETGKCLGCGSSNIVKAKVGELDKELLKKKFEEGNKPNE